jgi:6-phosphofructokinase 1
MGNRELGGIGRTLRHELQQTTGDRVIYQRLGYLMRSGPPDALDRLVASNFASLAADLVLAGETGRLVAITGGRYSTVPINTIRAAAKQVDVDRFYDRANYRPKIVGVLDLPMFLH